MKKTCKKGVGLLLSVLLASACWMSGAAAPEVQDPGFEVRMSEADFYVSAPRYTNASGEITGLTANDTVTVTVDVQQEAAVLPQICVAVGVYNAADTLEGIAAVTDTQNSVGTRPVAVTMQLPAAVDDGYYLKTFVMDSLTGLYTFNETFRFPEARIVESAWHIAGNWSMSSGDKQSGLSALRVDGTGAGSSVWQEIGVQSNYQYKLTYSYTGAAACQPVIQSPDGMVVAQGTAAAADGWTDGELVFDAGANSILHVAFQDTAAGVAYVDDVAIEVVKTNNLLEGIGGFENGIDNWSYYTTGTTVEPSSDAYTGSSALATAGITSGSQGMQFTGIKGLLDSMGDVSGSVYQVDLWAKAKNSGEVTDVSCKYKHNPSSATQSSATFRLGDEWRRISFFFDPTGYSDPVFYLETGTQNAKDFIIDDVRILRTKGFVNSGFEDGLDYWAFYLTETNINPESNTASKIELDTEQAHSGSNSLKIISNDGRACYMAQEFITQPNTDYELSYWVRQGAQTVSFLLADPSKPYYGEWDGGFLLPNTEKHTPPSNNNEWTQGSYTFNSGSFSRVRLYIKVLESSPGTIANVDDVQITPVQN